VFIPKYELYPLQKTEPNFTKM